MGQVRTLLKMQNQNPFSLGTVAGTKIEEQKH